MSASLARLFYGSDRWENFHPELRIEVLTELMADTRHDLSTSIKLKAYKKLEADYVQAVEEKRTPNEGG